MGFIIGLVIFGIPSAIIAGVKGFKPFRWLIAFGLIGLIVVASMASATAKGITEEDAQTRADKADKVGAIMAWLNIGLSIILLLVILGQS
jgi:hypothetical protein